jgi:anti-sigma B factor antagonist
MPSDPEPAVERVAGSLVVHVRGEFDLVTAATVWAALEQAVVSGDRLVLDLADVTFIDSSGLSVILRAFQVLGPDGSLVIRSPRSQARRLFETSGVESVFTFEP